MNHSPTLFAMEDMMQCKPMAAVERFCNGLNLLRSPVTRSVWMENTQTGEQIELRCEEKIIVPFLRVHMGLYDECTNSLTCFDLAFDHDSGALEICLEWPGYSYRDGREPEYYVKAPDWLGLVERARKAKGIPKGIILMVMQIGGVVGYNSVYRVMDAPVFAS